MKKHNCTYCGKSVARLVRHMQTIHKINLHSLPPPTNLKDFAILLAQFPLSIDEWNHLLINSRHLDKFIREGEQLPSDISKILYLGLQQYNANPLKMSLTIEKRPDLKEITADYMTGQFIERGVNSVKRLEKNIKRCVKRSRPKLS